MQKHAGIQGRVVHITKSCQDIVAGLRQDCTAISHDSNKAHNEVLHARKALHTAFLTHRSTCRYLYSAMPHCRRISSKALPKWPWKQSFCMLQEDNYLHSMHSLSGICFEDSQRMMKYTDAFLLRLVMDNSASIGFKTWVNLGTITSMSYFEAVKTE